MIFDRQSLFLALTFLAERAFARPGLPAAGSCDGQQGTREVDRVAFAGSTLARDCKPVDELPPLTASYPPTVAHQNTPEQLRSIKPRSPAGSRDRRFAEFLGNEHVDLRPASASRRIALPSDAHHLDPNLPNLSHGASLISGRSDAASTRNRHAPRHPSGSGPRQRTDDEESPSPPLDHNDLSSSMVATITTSVSVRARDAAPATTTNALSVLESAIDLIPTSIVNSIESVFFGDASSTSSSTSPTHTTHSRTGNHNRPTTKPTDRPTNRPPLHHTTHKSTTSSTLSTTLSTSATSTTNTISAGNTAGANATQEHVVGSHPLPNAAVAGIASGLSAGAVLVGLAAIFLWRRRSQGKPVFHRSQPESAGADGRTYPEVAWLYDPVMTRAGSQDGGPTRSRSNSGANLIPSRSQSPEAGPSRSRSNSGANLIPAVPDPRPESFEMDSAQFFGYNRVQRPSSPLLTPEIRVSRGDETPYDPHSRPNSEDNLRLPMRSTDEGA